MGAQGSQSGISVLEETIWGENPGTQMTGLNFVSESLSFAISNQVSNNIRPDRQTTDLIQVSAECSGGFETEFQAYNLDSLLPGFLWDDNGDWNTAPADDSIAFTVEGVAGEGGTMVFSTLDTSTLFLGQLFQVTGSVSNDGWYVVKGITDATTISVGSPLVTESSVAVSIGGDYIRNGVFKTSFTIERANYDISQFFTYLGMVPNTMEFTIESGSPLGVTLDFVGKNETLAQVSPNTPDPTELPATPIMNAVSSVGAIAVDGQPLEACLLQSINFTVDNQVEGKTGVGVLGFCDATAMSLLLSGSISMYFNDETYYEKYLNSESFALNFEVVDGDGNAYAFRLPKCKFDTATANVTGKDDDVMVECSFVGIMDDVELYTIQISRALV